MRLWCEFPKDISRVANIIPHITRPNRVLHQLTIRYIQS